MNNPKDEKGRFLKGYHYSPETEFKKGHQSFNKGMKQTEYLSADALEKAASTRFKKGHRPATYRPIGSTRITRDGYREIKISTNKWRLEHLVVWEKEHGPLPAGHCVIHLNQDKLDNRLENLMLIPRAINSTMCHLHLYSTDPELTKTGIEYARFKQALSKVRQKEGGTNNGNNIPRGNN